LQARVEPRFLVDTLQGVGTLYETDREAADRMLNHLIVYLRAALPQMRSSTSTFGQEVRLAQAYLAIERIRLKGSLEVDFVVPTDLNSVAFPPMVLLPAIAAFALEGAPTTEVIRTVRVEAREDSDALAIALSSTGTRRIATDAVDGLRSRLSALYGAAARLDVGWAGPGRAIAELRVPHEPTARMTA
jgi:LytS/YehU family sensor histidine kinase